MIEVEEEPASPAKKKPRKPRVKKPRMVIAHYHVTCGDRPCRLDKMLHKDGVLVVCAEGEEPHTWHRDWGSQNALGPAKNAANAAIRRTLETAKQLRGSMLTEVPRVIRFLAQTGTLALVPVKEPSRAVQNSAPPATLL